MGTQPPLQKGRRAPSPIFGPFLLWPNSWMDPDGTWHGGGPSSRPQCGPSSLPEKGASPLPNFWPISTVAKRLDASRCHLVWRLEVGLSLGDFVLDGEPSPPQNKFSAHVSYSYCDFVSTLHSRYWFVQVQVLVLYAFYF